MYKEKSSFLLDAEENKKLITKVSMVVENAEELVELIKKAQRQGAELRETIFEIENWVPNLHREE